MKWCFVIHMLFVYLGFRGHSHWPREVLRSFVVLGHLGNKCNENKIKQNTKQGESPITILLEKKDVMLEE